VLTGGGDGRESPDFEGAAAVRHGGRLGLVRRRRSDARLATGSGVEGMTHRLGAYGGDGVLRRLPRPAQRSLAPKAVAAAFCRGPAQGREEAAG
jgi:hypothetical protein